MCGYSPLCLALVYLLVLASLGISPCVFALQNTDHSDILKPGVETKLRFELGVCNKADNLNFTRSGATVSAPIVEFFVLYRSCDGSLVRDVTDVSKIMRMYIIM